jgi:hypothetical protein
MACREMWIWWVSQSFAMDQHSQLEYVELVRIEYTAQNNGSKQGRVRDSIETRETRRNKLIAGYAGTTIFSRTDGSRDILKQSPVPTSVGPALFEVF